MMCGSGGEMCGSVGVGEMCGSGGEMCGSVGEMCGSGGEMCGSGRAMSHFNAYFDVFHKTTLGSLLRVRLHLKLPLERQRSLIYM